MANDRVQRRLEHLKELRIAGPSEATIKELRAALRDRVNVIVAKAAAIADEWQAQTLLPDLLGAFDRLFVTPEAVDPQCSGKNAISKALKNLGCADSSVFLRGLQHRQWEAVWGGKTDTAGVLRSTCALALVQCTDIPRQEILVHLVNALTESEATVRADAARALEQMGGKDVALLLRLKARADDNEARVTGQVLESLLQLEGADGVPFVAGFLQDVREEVSEEAALALGVSRLTEAVQALKEAWLKPESYGGAVLLRAISASRLDQAIDFLLEQIRTARLLTAAEALRALELHRDSEQIVKRIEEAVSSREEELRRLYRENFS
jgi:HEAT repeat protein